MRLPPPGEALQLVWTQLSIPHLFPLQDRDQHGPIPSLWKWVNAAEFVLVPATALQVYQMLEGLDVSPMTLRRQKATSSVPADPGHLPGVNQLHTHWTCFGCEGFCISAAFLLGAAASPGTPWAPRKAFQPGLSAGLVRIDFLCPFSLVLQRGQAVSHVSLSLFVKDSLPH